MPRGRKSQFSQNIEAVGSIFKNVALRHRELAEARNREAFIRASYHPEIANRMLTERYWTGQTALQLTHAMGPPVAVDQKYLKTRSREVWKYHPSGSNRYNLRVTLDNGLVSGWDSKG